MAREVVIFPVSKEASADSYLDFCNLHNPDNTPGAIWYDVVYDRHGQRVVAYLGPTGFDWMGEPYPEPEGGVEARADGVLSSTIDREEEV